MPTFIIDWLIGRATRTPYTHIYHKGDLYMERYWLVPYRFEKALRFRQHPIGWLLQRFDIAVRIHHIVRPDKDRAMHDHPWNFTSVVLRGGYWEMLPDTVSPCFDDGGQQEDRRFEFHPTGTVIRRYAGARHRIDSLEGDTWTLFITGTQRQWWGFYTKAGKVYYRDYIEEAYK